MDNYTLWNSPQREIDPRKNEPDDALQRKFEEIARNMRVREEAATAVRAQECLENCRSWSLILG